MSVKSLVKPHPNPLLGKEREQESCLLSGIFAFTEISQVHLHKLNKITEFNNFICIDTGAIAASRADTQQYPNGLTQNISQTLISRRRASCYKLLHPRNALASLRLCGSLRQAVRVASRREASTLFRNSCVSPII
ncbi:hypothetical protein [Nostoc sp.]|uniref:hypothetical protein n=1 Tax=Nostoc sp. TaxID=1180 RepID=UPI002FF99722